MRALVTAFAAALALLCAAAPAAADREKAAVYFKRAQEAEREGDHDRAVTYYRRAYELAPHPTVLYNIAVNLERQGELRDAASHFQAYLEEAGDADDREQVLERIAGLARRPCQVEIRVTPEQATVEIGGQPKGEGSRTVELAAGPHRVQARQGGRRSPARQIVCEYGDRHELGLDLATTPGMLQVLANIEGAEVLLDGQPIGETPLRAEVPAGEHLVVVQMNGYRPERRSVSIAPLGSDQIVATLIPLEGEDGPPRARGPHSLLLGAHYGSSGGDGGRGAFAVGYRPPVELFEASFVRGNLGNAIGTANGAEARLYFSTSQLRPYLRGGAFFGSGSLGREDGVNAYEAGLGLLWTGRSAGAPAPILNLEYFFEVSGQVRKFRGELSEEEESASLSFPIVFGLVLRFG